VSDIVIADIDKPEAMLKTLFSDNKWNSIISCRYL